MLQTLHTFIIQPYSSNFPTSSDFKVINESQQQQQHKSNDTKNHTVYQQTMFITATIKKLSKILITL